MAKKALGFAQVATLIIVLSPSSIHGNVGPGDNAAEFNILCEVISLAESAPTVTTVQPAPISQYDELLRLNMTVADEKWQKMFLKTDDPKVWHKTRPEAIADPGDWDSNWASWTKAAEELTQADKMAEIKKLKLEEANPNQLTQIRTELKKLAAAAKSKMADRQALEDKLRKAAGNLGETLKDKAYGNKEQTATSVLATNAFGNGADSYARVCTGEAATNKLSTVAGTIACLCNKAAAATEAAVCGRSAKLSTSTWTVGSAPDDNVIREPLKFCNKYSSKELTSATLYNVLTAINRQIKVTSSDGILGTLHSGNCDGANTGGICIKLTSWATDGRADITKLQWAQKLKTLADELRQREEAANEAKQVDAEIKKLHAEAMLVRENTRHIQETAQIHGDGKQAPSSSSKERSGGCNNHTNKTVEECKTLGCDYDVENKKCKPKDGEGQTNTPKGTGEGATGATNSEAKKCSDKTKQEECKDGCKWENNACKDSSILTSKQFALSVVSAAFVALLF
uniref:Variant surface glycoprotein 424 n=1 Tax=Trypanosoma brucei TaxID=5691 RepID=M4SX09_9TRYP|nr:variant surface glycoprotein 424 [Trypanosoma brucei]